MSESEQIKVLNQRWTLALSGTMEAVAIPSAEGFLPQDVEKWAENTQGAPKIFRFLPLQESYQPYGPFLGWIKDQLKESPEILPTSLETADIYTLHKPVLTTWLQGSVPQRKEPLLPGEEAFESFKMRQGIWELLSLVLGAGPTILILEQVQDLGRGTLNLLTDFFKKERKAPLLLILTMKVGFEPKNQEESAFWSAFLAPWESKKLPGLWLGTGDSRGKLKRYSLKSGNQALEKLNELVEFFCWEEALDLSLRMLSLQSKDPGFLNLGETDRLYELTGELELRRGDGVSAQVYWGHLLSRQQERSLEGRVIPLWIKLAWSAGLTGDGRQMEPWLEHLSHKSLSPLEDCLVSFLKLWKDNLDRSLDFTDWKILYRKFIAQGQELDLPNTLAYWLVNPFRMDSLDSLIEASYFQDWGIGLSEKMGNELRLSDAYLIRGHFWTLKGDWDKVMDAFQKSEELKIHLGATGALAAIYNGRGFFLMESGSFLVAQENFYKALDCLKAEQNFKEIALTLFNLGTNFFRSGHWEEAEICYSRLLDLMSLLGMENLVFHSRRELMILLGLTYVKLGHQGKAYELWLRILGAQESLRSEVEMLWFWALSGWINNMKGDTEQAREAFSQGLALISQEKYYLQFTVPYFYKELGDFYQSLNQPREALAAYKKGFQASFQFPNFHIRSVLDFVISPTKTAPEPQNLGPLRLDFDWILEAGKAHKALRALKNQKTTLEVLKSLITLVTLQTPEEDLLQEAMRLFQRTCLFDFTVLIQGDGSSWKEVYSTAVTAMPWKDSLLPAMEILRPLGKSVFIKDPLSHGQLGVLNLPFPSLVSVQGSFYQEYQLQLLGGVSPLFEFHEECLDPLNLGLELLASHIGHKRREILLGSQNTELYRMATVDGLTGLPNRRALQLKLKEEEGRVVRYKSGGLSLSLLLLDVGNMTLLNRERGFSEGDRVLKTIGGKLKALIRGVDTLGRYSGDRFLLILPETTGEGAEMLAKRIQANLNTDEMKELRFCIGGASFQTGKSLIESLERALKDAKSHSTSGITVV